MTEDESKIIAPYLNLTVKTVGITKEGKITEWKGTLDDDRCFILSASASFFAMGIGENEYLAYFDLKHIGKHNAGTRIKLEHLAQAINLKLPKDYSEER